MCTQPHSCPPLLSFPPSLWCPHPLLPLYCRPLYDWHSLFSGRGLWRDLGRFRKIFWNSCQLPCKNTMVDILQGCGWSLLLSNTRKQVFPPEGGWLTPRWRWIGRTSVIHQPHCSPESLRALSQQQVEIHWPYGKKACPEGSKILTSTQENQRKLRINFRTFPKEISSINWSKIDKKMLCHMKKIQVKVLPWSSINL